MDVVAFLEELTRLSPAPCFTYSDNGLEFIFHALRSWSKICGTGTVCI